MDEGPGGPIIVPCGNMAATFYMEGLICFGELEHLTLLSDLISRGMILRAG